VSPSRARHRTVADLRCPYCRSRHVVLHSPDHVIPRSCGGGLVVWCCDECNTDANHEIDQAILRDPDLSRLRSEAGVRDQRTGEPVSYQETIDAHDGKRALLRWGEDGPMTVKFLPVPIPRPDGDVDIFVGPDDFAAHDAAQRDRAARDGHELGDSYEPDPSLLEHPPGSTVTILMRTRSHGVPPWLWPSLAARIVLGAIRRGRLCGLIETEPEPLMARLSALARKATIHLDMWSEEEIAAMPSRPPASHPLLGALRRHEHLIYIGPRDPGSDVTVMHLVLFGARLYELRLPELQILTGAAWLLDARTAKFTCGTVTEILDKLRSPTAAQGALFAD
jgi:hypothetical protein